MHPDPRLRAVPCVVAALAAGLSATASAAGPEVVRLDVTRDTWVSEVGPEAEGNNGAAPRLKLKSIQEMSLIDFDPAPLRGRVVTEVKLHLKLAGDAPLQRVTVSGVGAEWFEGNGTNYARIAGGATFRHRRFPDLPWSSAKPIGDLCHVILGNGGTSWGMADASEPGPDGWQEIPVRPQLLAARAAGLSHGLLVFDDTGSEWTREGDRFTLRLFPNRFVFSRDQNRASAPYVTATLGAADRELPAAPTGLRQDEHAGRDLPPGEAIVRWATPRDRGPAGTLGFNATLDGRPLPRELIPLAGAPGQDVEMHLRDLGLENADTDTLTVKAVDGAGNAGPAASATLRSRRLAVPPLPVHRLESPPAAGAALPAPPRLGGGEVTVIDELDKIHPETGALIPPQEPSYLKSNHLWDAAGRTIRLHAARNEIVGFQVLLRGRQLGRDVDLAAELSFSGRVAKVQAACGRYHLVSTPEGPLPDPIVPLGVPAPRLPAAPPARRPAGAGRAEMALSQGLHIEAYVPHDTPPGSHRGTLALRSGPDLLTLAVVLRVWDFALPDRLSFLPEMNAYGLPENERDYYRLAHRHRTVLNRLPYHQNGAVAEGCAPRRDRDSGTLDWTDWDRRFGPLLDGTAFSDLPRKGVPVECYYLPLHENWPSPMEGNYNGSYWADQAFPESYRRAFVAAARDFTEHFRHRGWNSTLFQGFLNNKNNFKAAGWSRGSSPWLLDEPANLQDFWALRYFARAFREGVEQARAVAKERTGDAAGPAVPRMVFRADISRPQWRRDALDGLIGYHVVSSAMREYPRLVFDRKRRFGELVVEYGTTNGLTQSNVQPAAWCLDAWSLGADGVVPWQTIGTAESWRKADELALFYPLPSSRGRAAGVVPSIRLKAYLRGQQDVEYLALWAGRRGLPRWAVGRQVREALRLAGTRQATESGGAEDAGRLDYATLRPQDLWALRVGVGSALSSGQPAAGSRQ
jgi:hypothetical protein